MASVLFYQFVLLFVSTSFHAACQLCVNRCSSTVQAGTWNSEIRLSANTSNSLFVEWNVDTVGSGGYFVQYQMEGAQSYTTTAFVNSSVTSLNITALSANTMYNLRVCREANIQGSADNCGSCILCGQTPQAQVAPNAPRSLTATTTPETISLQWSKPAGENAGVITNYSVTCMGSDSMNHTTVRFFPTNNAFFSDLTPETLYVCSVVARNMFGASPPVVTAANTTMRTDDPGALFIYMKPNITYITATSADIEGSGGVNIVNPPVLLTTTDDIQDIDYDYQKSLLYFTAVEVGGVSVVKRAQVQLGMNGGNFEITLNGSVETLLSLGTEVTVSQITVDWVNSELYYNVNTTSSSTRIYRLVLNETGSDILAQSCVVELVNTAITNIKVDPVHGFFYYGTGTTLFRVDLSSVQINTVTCPSSIRVATAIGSFDALYGFTIEQDEAIYILAQEIQTCGVNGRALSLNLGGQNNTLFSYSSSILFTIAHLDSFTQYIVVGVGSRIIYVPTVTVNAGCGIQGIIVRDTPRNISLIRMFRSSQQPTPVPLNSPTIIRVSTERNIAAVSWSAPLFPGSLYSADAFDGWTYYVRYCLAGTQNCMEATTMELSILLTVEYDTSYVVSVSAVGPGGQSTTSSEVLFTSELDNGMAAQLVIAHETGVIRSDLSGQSAEMVVDSRASSMGTPASIAVDSYTDTIYWSSEGSSASVYSKRGSLQPQALYSNRDQPFALEYDWVGNRLLWVEDGVNPQDPRRAILGDLENPSTPPTLFVETNEAVASAVDSTNGLFFWTDRTTIHLRTLSGIHLTDCHAPPDGVSSLAVDAARRNLFWLSSASTGQNLKISQLDYTGTECNATTVAEQDLSGISLSSSSTVLVYASNQLFFTSRLSSKIYTVSSHLASVGVGQSLALGEVTLAGTTNKTSALEIRDMAVSSTSLQTLPGTLTPQSRGLSGLQPFVPSREPYLNATLSNSTSIVIMWGRSEVMGVDDATIFYEISYTLRKGATVKEGSMLTLDTFVRIDNQQTDTNVTASVVAISSWTRSTETATASFLSLPPRPGQVVNVQVFLYNPLITDPALRTALVIWNNVDGSVTSFSVRVIDYSTGMELSPLDEPRLDLKTSYSVLLTESGDDPPSFPLVIGQSYGVEVCAVNAAGAGLASDRVNFTVSATGLSYPFQVLSLESSGLEYYGLSTSINQKLTVESDAGPIVVDTVDRRAYWYEETFNLINSQPLGIGGVLVPFLTMPTGTRVVSLTYDWIAKVVYVSRVDLSTRQLELVKVEIFDIDRQQSVFPNLQFTLPENAVVNSEMNPVTGFFYWSINGTETSIYRLNLRNNGTTTISPVTVGGSRRRRRRATVSDLTPALTLDPVTNNLLVSDEATGDILQCSQTFASCMVYVNRSALEASSGRVNVGLPAGSIKYGGQFIYWTSTSSSMPGVFAVDTSDRSTLIVVNNQSTPRFIVPLSPNQQPLPDIGLLAPSFLPINRQDISIVKRTSTTLLVTWRNSDTFGRDFSDDMPFSLAPFIYDVENRLSMDQATEHVTRMRRILFTDLIPFTEYAVFVAATNQYFRSRGTSPFEFVITSTTEGVPDPPAFEMFNVTGTTTARIQWFNVRENALRGPENNRAYIVSSGIVNITTPNNYANVSGPVASRFTVQLYTFNGVFVSSRNTSVSIQLWNLVQQPQLVTKNRSSLVVNVTISADFFGDIQEVGVMACDMSRATVTADNCTCVNFTESLDDLSYVPIVKSMTQSFLIDDLSVFTEYCIYPIGSYVTSEVTGGVGVVLTTASGVPNAPNITRNDEVLNWSHPDSNGVDITSYTVYFRPTSRAVDPVMVRLVPEATTYTLDGADIMQGVEYTITLVATNPNGNSNESNSVMFELGPVFPTTIVAASAAIGGTLILSACIICVIIVCFVRARNTKRELRLSYMYGPDHELSNLRDAMRNTQSSNPHYTWSLDDYVCTDEDLNLLTKFPRTNLKLETFIDRGEFGEVFQGTATDILGAGTGPTPVAVKTLRKGATMDEQRKFLSEAALMGNFNHPNILKVLGVCVDNDPVYIILELMPGGDLLKFLRKAKMDHGPTLLTLPEQIQVALDVAHGCHYLEQQHFIHRDIAARNCLVSSKGADRVVKIGDFGLAKDLYSSDYYQVEGQRKLPVRWMAPEALLQGKFTVESDIWSYGVLLWEIMTLGNQPYPGRINQEVLQFVTGGGRLDRPDKCPSKIYQLMQHCWRRYASDRPHFEHIVNTLTAYLDRLKRPDSVYNSDSDSDEDAEGNHVRQGSSKLPARTPSMRSTGRGIMNLARSGSMKLRNSFRRHNSTHKREEHMTNSQQDDQFRERGPF